MPSFGKLKDPTFEEKNQVFATPKTSQECDILTFESKDMQWKKKMHYVYTRMNMFIEEIYNIH